MHMFDCGVSDEDRNWAEMPTSLRRRGVAVAVAAVGREGGLCQSRFGDGDILGRTPSHIRDEQ